MEFFKALGQGWIGSLIGLIGLIIAFLLYRASRVGPRPVYQRMALRLIGMKEQALPKEVTVLFKGKSVPRLTKTYIVLWNSGKAAIKGEDIVIDDQLRLEFPEDSEVLSVRIIKETHKPNKFTVNINKQSPNVVFCNFDYLNTVDGVTLELLHTSKERYPLIRGSIRGIPKGVSDWGFISSQRVRTNFPFNIYSIKIMSIIGIIMGITFITCGIFIPNSPDKVLIGIGIFLTVAYSLYPWLYRRRFPKVLSIEDL